MERRLSLTWVISAQALVLAFLLFTPCNIHAQNQPPPTSPATAPPPDQTLTPDQLDDLVAPVALYPDVLLSQLLVAATYPLEVVQAYQWLQKNPGLRGPELTQAAQEQNWDASVQALVVFPDVLKRLNDDVTWTTNLGNAFLAQQQDVMDAVQRMRQKAQEAGKLSSTPQETVTAGPDIEIEPVDPNILYVPVYDPVWIWGPALWYPYPLWYWPPYGGVGFGFGLGINVGFFFGAGWHGWGGWGWHPGWRDHNIIVNNTFIHQNNFNTRGFANVHGTSTWAHDPAHREGVPYARSDLNQRYRAPARENLSRPSVAETRSGLQGQGERIGNREVPRNSSPAQGRSAFGGQEYGRGAQTNQEHGYSSLGGSRSSPGVSAPRGGGSPGGGGFSRGGGGAPGGGGGGVSRGGGGGGGPRGGGGAAGGGGRR